ncbi:MBL fold metallo-hydrolase [Leadbetterella sp. DM7]|uniref:MBL fold metallo-hydrolase n=1 Tax=Leadbetterella sp. DM7 TaxID=3235085 RepID=UPI00349F01F0
MRLSVIDAGNFKLDGGAMFGVVPKSIWNRSVPADENNMCNFKMRCLLVEEGSRLVLIDTGMGEKQPEKWQSYYYRNGEGELKKSIMEAGYAVSDVTDVILSHLHFDHCGGAVERHPSGTSYRPVFPSAKYWTHSAHYESAVHPNAREKATFLEENIHPLVEAGQLYFIDQNAHGFSDAFEFTFVDGHTEKMIMTLIRYRDKKLMFAADTVPTYAHIHIPYVMSYDIAPLKSMEEKKVLLDRLIREDIVLFFDHDVEHEACIVVETERGYRAGDMGTLADFGLKF